MFAGKLKEFNNNIEGDKKIDETRLARLEGIMKETLPSDDDLNTLKAALEWPPSKFMIKSLTFDLFSKARQQNSATQFDKKNAF
jgi:hypothetical protein